MKKIIAQTTVDGRFVQPKQFTGFSRMSVMANVLRLGALLRDNL